MSAVRYRMSVRCALPWLLTGSRAFAQTGTCEAPDVVLTVDGGMLRGLIAESVPGDHVVIRLATCETRTIPAAQVRFAGPRENVPPLEIWEGAPPEPTPATPIAPTVAPPTSDAATVQVTFRGSSELQLTLHRLTRQIGVRNIVAAEFERLCTLPCTATVPRGETAFGVGHGLAFPSLLDETHDLQQSTTFDVSYHDRTGEQVAGGLILGLGGPLGSVLAIIGLVIAVNPVSAGSGGVLFLVLGAILGSAAFGSGFYLAGLRNYFLVEPSTENPAARPAASLDGVALAW